MCLSLSFFAFIHGHYICGFHTSVLVLVKKNYVTGSLVICCLQASIKNLNHKN